MPIILKSDDEIAIMREAGRIVAETMQKLLAALRPGLVVKELDRMVRDELGLPASPLGPYDVSMVFFGEGTSSTGEFHVGMNFAGVWKAPCVFICRNNGWAISVPREKQTAAKSFAAKAVGYGMPGVRVDGNDILAVLQVATEAIERARAGEGPTLIEALTYRVQGHSSSDDPSVYRDPKEPEIWEKRDPLNRLRAYMRHRGLWTEAMETRPSSSTSILQPVRSTMERIILPPGPMRSRILSTGILMVRMRGA